MKTLQTAIANNWQKLSASIGVSTTALLAPVVASASDLTDVTKNAGGSMMNYIIIGVIVAGVLGAAIGILMHASGIQLLSQMGTKRILVGIGAIVGILMLGAFIGWIIGVMNGAGGNMSWQWPF
ncbi:hypothetical protein K1728_00885 [Weissella confusa]|uniref:hypothetical protein n=1 Tax=Weissella confusa TaxID=1583 RepID=UPI001C6FA45D|nr:hypothetical protein [Weissella confusa]QYU58001.1 hypothetical protein K1728_00885 [Weissella confusa]